MPSCSTPTDYVVVPENQELYRPKTACSIVIKSPYGIPVFEGAPCIASEDIEPVNDLPAAAALVVDLVPVLAWSEFGRSTALVRHTRVWMRHFNSDSCAQ